METTTNRLRPPEKPRPPALRQVVTNDVTSEKLAVILGNNPRGVIRVTDELAAFIQMMNQYHGGHGADRQLYLSTWSGSTIQVDRKGSDTPVVVREPFVNVLGGIQPDMLGTLEDARGRDDGLLSRFLFSFPDPPPRRHWDESLGVSTGALSTWSGVIDWLLGLSLREPDADSPWAEPLPRTVAISAEAMAAWRAWHERHWDEAEWDCFPPHLRGLWSKFEVHALTLVLTAHMLEVACRHTSGGEEYAQEDPPIDAESMRRGLALADYFKDHNVRVLNRLKVSQEDLKLENALRWIRKRPGRQATQRELQANGVAGIKTATEARKVLQDLCDRGLGEVAVTPGKGPKGGTSTFQAS